MSSILFLGSALCAHAQLVADTTKAFLYSPAGSSNKISATHIKVPGIGNFDATFQFNPTSRAFELEKVTASATDETTEQMAGLYSCTLWGGTKPVLSLVLQPAGRDLMVGGALQYRYLGLQGTNVYKYTVSFADGGKYLLSLIKNSKTDITAILGYLAPGATELDTGSTLQCAKNS